MLHFQLHEFQCPCCKVARVDEDLTTRLDRARTIAGIPFVITSGYRCRKHNKEVGGVTTSAHTLGKAVDIAAHSSHDKFLIVGALLNAGFKRIGVGKDFIHADVDLNAPNPVIWTY